MSSNISAYGLLVAGLALVGCSSSSKPGTTVGGGVAGPDSAGQTATGDVPVAGATGGDAGADTSRLLDLGSETRTSAYCDPNRAVEAFYDSGDSTHYKGGWGTRFQMIFEGPTQTQVTYGDAGRDKLWLTEDDSVRSYTKEEMSGAVRIKRSFTAPGPDGKWFTADDLSTGASCENLNSEGRVESAIGTSDPGADGKLCTSDDVYSTSGTIVYSPPNDPNSRMVMADGTRYTNYSSPGPDKIWLTADDVVESVGRFTSVADGSSASRYTITDPGSDGRYGTADDSEHLSRTYSSSGPDRADMKMLMNGNWAMGMHYFCIPPSPF